MQIRKHNNINQTGRGRCPRATGIIADWTGPSFEPEGHGLHVFKIRALPVTTYALLFLDLRSCTLICVWVFWFAFGFFEVFWFFLICRCVFWFSFMLSDLCSCFLIYICVFWFAFVFSDLRSWFLIYVHVFWFAFMFSDLRLCFLIYVCVFWFVFVFSDLPLGFALQGHRILQCHCFQMQWKSKDLIKSKQH